MNILLSQSTKSSVIYTFIICVRTLNIEYQNTIFLQHFRRLPASNMWKHFLWEISSVLKLRRAETVEWVWESFLRSLHLRMKANWIVYFTLGIYVPESSLINKAALEELQGRVQKLVISLNMLLNLLLGVLFRNTFLISQNATTVTTLSAKLAIESLMICLDGVVYVYNTEKYKLKHFRKELKFSRHSFLPLDFHARCPDKRRAI